MLKIERNSQLMKVDRFLFGNANMAKIYERSLSTIIAQGKFRDSFDLRRQTLSGEDSTWKGDAPGKTSRCRLFFFFFFITRLTCFGCFKTDLLFCQASVKNQIPDTIGTLLHHIHVEFYRKMPCLLSTMFVTYFLEVTEEA